MGREETRCRFCNGELPDWKPVLTPSGEEVAIASPTMSVTFNGQVPPGCFNLGNPGRAATLLPGRPCSLQQTTLAACAPTAMGHILRHDFFKRGYRPA